MKLRNLSEIVQGRLDKTAKVLQGKAGRKAARAAIFAGAKLQHRQNRADYSEKPARNRQPDPS